MTITDQEVRDLWHIIWDAARTHGPGERMELPALSPEMIEERVQAEPDRTKFEAQILGEQKGAVTA